MIIIEDVSISKEEEFDPNEKVYNQESRVNCDSLVHELMVERQERYFEAIWNDCGRPCCIVKTAGQALKPIRMAGCL